jgi:hypothetical protein
MPAHPHEIGIVGDEPNACGRARGRAERRTKPPQQIVSLVPKIIDR